MYKLIDFNDSKWFGPGQEGGRESTEDFSDPVKFDNLLLQAEREIGDKHKLGGLAPMFHHIGVIYADNSLNTALSLNRLLSKREGEYDYNDKQRSFYMNSTTLRETIKSLRAHIRQFFLPVLTFTQQELITYYANMPHIKKKLRLMMLEELHNIGIVDSPERYVTSVSYFMKTGEWAKFAKVPRGICDLKRGALIVGFIAIILKEALATYENDMFKVVTKLNLTELKHDFKKLWSENKKSFVLLFSDDSCVNFTNNGVRVCGDADISSCDASHTEVPFTILEELTRDLGHLTMMVNESIEQCRLPLKIQLKTRYGETRKYSIRPHFPVLYSGSGLTTIINDIANIMIAVRLRENEIINGQCENMYMLSAYEVGYKVTFSPAKYPSQLSFLKHFPDNLTFEPCLCLGVLMRSHGVCNNELPGKGSFNGRIPLFISSVLTGMKYSGSHPLYEHLCKVHGAKTSPSFVNYMIEESYGSRQYNPPISIDSICTRYGIPSSSIYDTIDLYDQATPGDVIRTQFTVAVMNCDYDLGG